MLWLRPTSIDVDVSVAVIHVVCYLYTTVWCLFLLFLDEVVGWQDASLAAFRCCESFVAPV
jgi:hypothetical protein